MSDGAPEGDLAAAHRTATVVGGAMAVSVLTYAVVAEVVRAAYAPFRGFASAPAPEAFRYAFFIVALGALALSRAVRQAMLTARAPSGTAPGAAGPAGRLVAATVASLACSEVPALLGLIIFLLWGSALDFYILLGLSLLSLAVNFPRRSQWEEWSRTRVG